MTDDERHSPDLLLLGRQLLCKTFATAGSSRPGGMTQSYGLRLNFNPTRLGPTEGSAGLLLLLFKTLREHRRTPFVITASVFRAIGS